MVGKDSVVKMEIDDDQRKMGIEEEEKVATDMLGSVPRNKLTAPIKDIKDKYELLPHFLKMRGLVRQHIDSFNYLVNEEIKVKLSP